MLMNFKIGSLCSDNKREQRTPLRRCQLKDPVGKRFVVSSFRVGFLEAFCARIIIGKLAG